MWGSGWYGGVGLACMWKSEDNLGWFVLSFHHRVLEIELRSRGLAVPLLSHLMALMYVKRHLPPRCLSPRLQYEDTLGLVYMGLLAFKH